MCGHDIAKQAESSGFVRSSNVTLFRKDVTMGINKQFFYKNDSLSMNSPPPSLRHVAQRGRFLSTKRQTVLKKTINP
jgi:hypothetical protein